VVKVQRRQFSKEGEARGKEGKGPKAEFFTVNIKGEGKKKS